MLFVRVDLVFIQPFLLSCVNLVLMLTSILSLFSQENKGGLYQNKVNLSPHSMEG